MSRWALGTGSRLEGRATCFGEAVELGLVPAELQEELRLHRLPHRVHLTYFDEHCAHLHQSLRAHTRKEYFSKLDYIKYLR